MREAPHAEGMTLNEPTDVPPTKGGGRYRLHVCRCTGLRRTVSVQGDGDRYPL